MKVKNTWLKIPDAAKYFGIDRSTIKAKIDDGSLVMGLHIGMMSGRGNKPITLVNVQKLEELITKEALKKNSKLNNILERLI